MKRVISFLFKLAAIVLLLFFLAHLLPPLMDFFAWLFLTKEEAEVPLSSFWSIIIAIAAHLATFSLVGSIFEFLGWFNSSAMKITYVVISEIIALALVLLLRFILDYYWVILIVLAVFVLAGVIVFWLLFRKKKQPSAES